MSTITSEQPKKPEVSQKEYLKRYLSKDKGEKKKKKKVKISSSTHLKPSVIVDDDLGLPDIASIEDEEFNLDYLGDEAPQIAGVIDERPPEIKAKENYGDRNKWKSIGEPEELCGTESNSAKLIDNRNHVINNGKTVVVDSNKHVDSDNSSFNYISKSTSKERKPFKDRISRHSDSDVSPPRSKSRNKDKGKISAKKRHSSDEDSDISPPRSKIKDAEKNHFSKRTSRHDESSSRSKNKSYRKESSLHYDRYKQVSKSPLKERDKHRTSYNEHSKNRNKTESGSDLSPPRKSKYEDKSKKKEPSYDSRRSKYAGKVKRKGSDSDESPPRKNRYEGKTKRKSSDSDQSPPRKNRNERKIKRNGSDSDLSPPRKNKYEGRAKRKGSDSDLSPPRKNKSAEKVKRNGNDSDLSPPRKKNYKGRPIRKGSDSDLSPPRKSKHDRIEKSMDKTLDGKKAGLQDARNLKEELKKLKEAENAMFEKMKTSVSGKAASVVMRDRKTGKIRDLNKEKEEESQKSVKAAERESKYAKWGRGLKQVAEAEDRISDYLHEVNKPLARYAGDEDLEKILKARELQEDPMLDYIKNKQSESIDVEVKGKPTYRGYYLPNRFNIRPGHRWDGVDRSNGYEKQWFERKNAKKALEEEAYKWSTADM